MSLRITRQLTETFLQLKCDKTPCLAVILYIRGRITGSILSIRPSKFIHASNHEMQDRTHCGCVVFQHPPPPDRAADGPSPAEPTVRCTVRGCHCNYSELLPGRAA